MGAWANERNIPGETVETRMPRILLIDDSQLLCEGVERALRSKRIKCVSTTSAAEALELVDRLDFDAVITDLQMPEMSGDELMRRLYKVVPKLPCLVLTGNATRDTVLMLRDLPNLAGILTKPWDRDRLLERLAAVLASR